MRGVDEPYQQWEKRPPFVTKEGRTVYPLYAPAYMSQGSHIRVFDREVDPTDSQKHQVAFLDWYGDTISVVDTHPDWQRQGVAKHMLELARAEEPHLRHAPCHRRREDGERFVRGTDPGEACRGECGPRCCNWPSQIGMSGQEKAVASVRPLGWWAKIKVLIGF